MDSTTNSHGCHNRDPFEDYYLAQDGYHVIGGNIQDGLQMVPKFKKVKHRMSTDCRYDNQKGDPQCAGCRHIKE